MWKPVGINTLQKHISDGEPFLGRYKDALGEWQTAVVYYGQHGHCFVRLPLPFICYKEVADSDFGPPEFPVEEWCELPK